MEISTKEQQVVNKYRCETCKNRDQNGYGWCRFAKSCVNPIPPNTSSIHAEFTKRCGCASHSDLQKVQEDKLDRFVDWCSSFDDYTCGSTFTPSFVLKKLASIRKEGKAGE